MPLMNIEDPDARPGFRVALFNLGFRPFFLVAGIAACLLMALWLYSYTRGQLQPVYYGFVGWHSHEMVFGYTVAVIAGFLLTAVRNWTGIQTPSGVALAGLMTLWVAGRIAPFFPDELPQWIIAGVDLAFLPVLARHLVASVATQPAETQPGIFVCPCRPDSGKHNDPSAGRSDSRKQRQSRASTSPST